MQSLSQSIQQAIQKKDEEVKWIDSCCLQFSVPGKSKFVYLFSYSFYYDVG